MKSVVRTDIKCDCFDAVFMVSIHPPALTWRIYYETAVAGGQMWMSSYVYRGPEPYIEIKL